jgi:hypothetical protein
MSDLLKQALEAKETGIYISNTDYHAMPGISGTKLALLAESNKHLDNAPLFNMGNTPALTFGSLFHTLTLEPENFVDEYAMLPKFDLRTNIGKAAKAQFELQYKDHTIITQDDYDKAKAMAHNVHAIEGDIIKHSEIEKSYFVEVDGLLLKCRLDCEHTPTGDDYDLKSIILGNKPFDNITLERHIKNMSFKGYVVERFIA